jgi:hypothetical protein
LRYHRQALVVAPVRTTIYDLIAIVAIALVWHHGRTQLIVAIARPPTIVAQRLIVDALIIAHVIVRMAAA